MLSLKIEVKRLNKRNDSIAIVLSRQRSSQDSLHDISVDVRQPVVSTLEAIGVASVVEAQ